MPTPFEFPLVIGTHNRKKGIELVELLAPLGFQIRTLADFPNALEVVEDGDTFAANAALKATQQAPISSNGCWPTTAAWSSRPSAALLACTQPASPAQTPRTKTITAAYSPI